jgi:hypothetical protein
VTATDQSSGPVRLEAGDVLERAFVLAESGEAWAALALSAPGTSWLRAELAVVTLAVAQEVTVAEIRTGCIKDTDPSAPVWHVPVIGRP